MDFHWVDLVLFAQDAVDQAGDAAAPQQGPGLRELLFPIMITMLLFYFLIVLPERKRSKKKQGLLENLKKNDKVITIGGIYGTVANVKPGEDDIVLKIDEDKDVKIKVSKSSIAHVLTAKEQDTT